MDRNRWIHMKRCCQRYKSQAEMLSDYTTDVKTVEKMNATDEKKKEQKGEASIYYHRHSDIRSQAHKHTGP